MSWTAVILLCLALLVACAAAGAAVARDWISAVPGAEAVGTGSGPAVPRSGSPALSASTSGPGNGLAHGLRRLLAAESGAGAAPEMEGADPGLPLPRPQSLPLGLNVWQGEDGERVQLDLGASGSEIRWCPGDGMETRVSAGFVGSVWRPAADGPAGQCGWVEDTGITAGLYQDIPLAGAFRVTAGLTYTFLREVVFYGDDGAYRGSAAYEPSWGAAVALAARF